MIQKFKCNMDQVDQIQFIPVHNLILVQTVDSGHYQAKDHQGHTDNNMDSHMDSHMDRDNTDRRGQIRVNQRSRRMSHRVIKNNQLDWQVMELIMK